LANLQPGTIYDFRLVATNGAGTTYGPDSSFATAVTPSAPGEPEAYVLKQNYPNPFNPGTTIEYDVYQAGIVTLKVFTLIGTEVATLVSGYEPTGRHLVEWVPNGVPSGVYFCALKSGGVTQTRRMVYVK
jgi:hypothetical protein